ncbi:hypothetical protein cypCar_00029881 [Cyprinus carpio]|nr:hypothetical protein cypCar_00029881 [Cyprinus carpio]
MLQIPLTLPMERNVTLVMGIPAQTR